MGVASQSTHYNWLQENVPDAILRIYPNDPDMFKEAELERIDALVTDTPVILAGSAAGESLVLCGEPLYYENASFTLAQGGADWRAVLNECIETMHSSGSLEEKSVLWNNGLDLTVPPPAELDLQL